jgi:C-terminal processing protease CtpA/Prc
MLAFVRPLAAVVALAAAFAQSTYERDVVFALDELEKQCGVLIREKKVDWSAARKEMARAAESTKTDQDELVLLTRLLARLHDGHAEVKRTAATRDVHWPDEPEPVGAGIFWCKSGKKILVRSAWNDAKASGIEPGMEIVKVDGKPVDAWLDGLMANLRDRFSFSTDQQAFFWACHRGLAFPAGTRIELELREIGGKAKKRALTYSRGSATPWGPAAFPPDLKSTDDLSFGLLKSGNGYVHVRRCKENLPAQVDEALAAVGAAKGLVLDFRGNSGGGFDHEDFMGRFVPHGTKLVGQTTYESRGEHPFGGNVVVIVNATVISAGETASGIFKEDGRAYMIGESPTAGMSSHKTTVALPSGKFELYVSIASNKRHFNGGKGIEGIGVIPHEIVELDAKDLARGADTLIEHADRLLAKFPSDKVPYRAP